MELAGNPLLLTMMAVIYKHQDLPEQRWKLYERCTEVLLEDWDIKRKSIGHDELLALDVNIRASQKMEILQRVSMYMLEHGQEGRELNAIAYDPLMDILAAYLEEKYSKPSGEAGAIAEGILNHLRERTYILAEVGERIFGFVHRTFMEYFAACDRRAAFNARRSDYEWLTGETFSKWQRDEWQEVLLLLIAMLSDQGSPIEDVVNYLRKNFKGGIPHNIAFAARCLAEAGAVKSESYAQGLMTELVRKIAQYTKPLRRPTVAGKAEAEKFVREALTAFSMLAALFTVPSRARAIIDGLNSSRRRSQRVAAWQMEVALRTRQQRLNFALSALSDKEEVVRMGAIATLHREWPGKDEVAEALIKVIKFDSNSRVREAAIQAMKNAWPDNVAILDALESRVDDETAYSFVTSVLNYIAANWRGNLRALNLLLRLAGRKRKASSEYDYYIVRDVSVRGISMGWAGNPDALALLQDVISSESDSLIRTTAILAMGYGWREHPDTLPLLLGLIVNGDKSESRSTAILSLTYAWGGREDLVSFLHDLALNDAETVVRLTALMAIGYGWRRHPDTLLLLRDRAVRDSDSDVRLSALKIIGGNYFHYWHGFMSDERQLNWMAHQYILLKNEKLQLAVAVDSDFQDRDEGWRRHPETLPLLRDRAANDPDGRIRGEALNAISGTWRQSPDTLSFLRERLASESDSSVRGTIQYLINWVQLKPDEIFF
jgi:HEAT repeat protein